MSATNWRSVCRVQPATELVGQVEIRFAGPSPMYFNTGFKEELAPFPASDNGPAAEAARAALRGCLLYTSDAADE